MTACSYYFKAQQQCDPGDLLVTNANPSATRAPSVYTFEATQVACKDENDGDFNLDIPALIQSPWLQAVYLETLRLRVVFNVVREVTEDSVINDHLLKVGHIVMAPTFIAHTLDPYWSTDQYAVREFWPERFLEFEKSEREGGATKATFSPGSKGGKMFPYGDGTALCPGRFFAKQEIMAAIALIVLNFDFEVLGFTKLDGALTDRGLLVDEACHGSGVAPPDRDMKVTLKVLETVPAKGQ